MRDRQPDPLTRVFADLGSEDSVRARERRVFDELTGGVRQAVIFGCGALGRILWNGAQAGGVPVVAFADNNTTLQGSTLNGIPVMSPEQAMDAFGARAYFAIGVFNSSKPRQQLRDLGCTRIVPYAAFLWRYRSVMPDPLGMDLPHRIVGSTNDVREGYECLDDDCSRREFAAQVAWRCTLEYSHLPAPDNPCDIYFPSELMRLSEEEVLVDCGAFDGESIDYFRRRTSNRYEHVYACEPDPKNLQTLEGYVSRLPAVERARTTVLPFAIGDRNGTVYFQALGTVSSRVTDGSSGNAVECRRLDSLLPDATPTIIKMDIEGAEPEAIRGAEEIICRARPILSVCAYHKNDHLWTIPRLIKTALPDYRVHLRRYAEECWETVYYAVPPERAVPSA